MCCLQPEVPCQGRRMVRPGATSAVLSRKTIEHSIDLAHPPYPHILGNSSCMSLHQLPPLSHSRSTQVSTPPLALCSSVLPAIPSTLQQGLERGSAVVIVQVDAPHTNTNMILHPLLYFEMVTCTHVAPKGLNLVAWLSTFLSLFDLGLNHCIHASGSSTAMLT